MENVSEVLSYIPIYCSTCDGTGKHTSYKCLIPVTTDCWNCKGRKKYTLHFMDDGTVRWKVPEPFAEKGGEDGG